MSTILVQRQHNPATLGDLLRLRAEQQPGRTAYVFLGGSDELSSWTYSELDRRARAVAAAIAPYGALGSPVLLAYDPGLDFLAGFFGCMYAGAVAVPLQMPRRDRQLSRIRAIARSANSSLGLTTAHGLDDLESAALGIHSLRWLPSDTLPMDAGPASSIQPLPEDVAYLQYTSGSTSEPRGVMLSHANVFYNLSYIDRDFQHGDDSVGITWLPHFHDMGLVYGLLQPLYNSYPCYVLPPAAFIQRPLTWLEAISRYRGTHSGGPNFAYELCLRKIDVVAANLDLSSWRVAFNGAEPIRGETLRRFSEAFEPCGFRRSVFYPAYGLAEATLKVSGTRWGELNETTHLDNHVVSCGRPEHGTQVAIVDPETAVARPAGEVGEIWVHGPGVGCGYWERPAETEEIFRARISTGDTRFYMRTGDLGFLSNGEIYVTGRLKDLLIVRGQNHYPQDLEFSAQSSHPAVDGRPGAVFAVEAIEEDRLVVVQEIDRHRKSGFEEIANSIRQAIAVSHGVQAQSVVLVRPGGVPRTTSGKIQRRLCRQQYLAGETAAVYASNLPQPSPDQEAFPRAADDIALDLASRYLRVAVSHTNMQQPLSALGLDSLGAFELRHHLEAHYDVEISVSKILQKLTLAGLSALIERSLGAKEKDIELAPESQAAVNEEQPLSLDQERLWLMDRISPGNSAYNLAVALRLKGRLDLGALQQALSEIERRHESLRIIFDSTNGRPVQRVGPPRGCCIVPVDLTSFPTPSIDEVARRTAIEHAHRPFELAGGYLFRAVLLKYATDDGILILITHHIVSDMWSMRILVQEIADHYRAFASGNQPSHPARVRSYAEHVASERHKLESGQLVHQTAWWRKKLLPAPPVLDLPYDRPRRGVRTYRGGDVTFHIDSTIWRALNRLAHLTEVTPFTLLLTAFYVLLARLTGQQDIVVGTPVLNRNHARDAEVIGFFASPLPLRLGFAANPDFADLARRVKCVVLEAFENQEVPFAQIIEVAAPNRVSTHTPLIQVLLGFMPRAEVQFTGLDVTSYNLESQATDFDLFLQLTEDTSGLRGSLRYDADVFEPKTAAALCSSYESVIRQGIENPRHKLLSFDLSSTFPARGKPKPKLSVASTFIAEPIGEVLEFWSRETGFSLETTFAPYNQVIQQLIDPSSVLNTNIGGINVLAVRLEDLVGRAPEANVEDFINTLRDVARRATGHYLVFLCPSRQAGSLGKLESRILAGLADLACVEVFRGDVIAADYAVDEWGDSTADELANIAYTPSFYAALATSIFRRFLAVNRPPVKAIVCDCDNTLWKGVCAEDGVTGVLFTPARQHLHDFLLAQRNAGVLLCLCSKNNEKDIANLFEERFDMSLRWSDFIARRINWQPKSENLRTLAAELGFNLDSIVFLDDDPLECAEVQAHCPEVVTVRLPDTEEAIERLLCHHWAFDLSPVTREGLRRDASYRENAQRECVRTQHGSLEKFLDDLELEVCFRALQHGDLERASELTRRVNQFHPAVQRRSVADIAKLMSTGQEGLMVSAKDRFGDYGQIGVVLFTVVNSELRVDSFALSCRALGRGIEHRIVSELGAIAEDRSLNQVSITYVPAPRNLPAFDFLESLKGTRVLDNDEIRYGVATHQARALRVNPNSYSSPVSRQTKPEADSANRRAATSPLFERIAGELHTADLILTAMHRANGLARRDKGTAYVAPRTPTEHAIAGIWTELLGVEPIGVYDNFFDVGGHSLKAVQIISRVHEAFGVEPPLGIFFETEPTVAQLAQAVEDLELRQAGQDRIATILSEVEDLSNDQIRDLLADNL